MIEKTWDAKRLTKIALAIAMVCVSTMAIQIPIPLGYMHLGNCCILLVSIYGDKTMGAMAGGLGSALADLLSGYPQWIIPTLLIKGTMGYATSKIGNQEGKKASVSKLRTLLATIVGILIMIGGYTLFGAVLYGSVAAGVAQVPGLTIEGVLGIVLFYALGFAFERGKAFKVQQQ